MPKPTTKPRNRWQFGLRTLFALMTCAAVLTAFLASERWAYLMGIVIIGNAILFCIIAGGGIADDNEEPPTQSTNTKELSE